jgi:hypothetical protein
MIGFRLWRQALEPRLLFVELDACASVTVVRARRVCMRGGMRLTAIERSGTMR